MSRRRPDVTTSSPHIKKEPTDDIPPSTPYDVNNDDDDDNDPIVRSIDVFISPELSNTLRLLQFPIEPANRQSDMSQTPTEAKFKPKHNMLEMQYEIPNSTYGGHRKLPVKMCLNQRTYTSNSINPVTHMALGKLNSTGTRLDVVPIQKSVLQMRPSFAHLHEDEEDDPNTTNSAADESKLDNSKSSGRQRPIMFAKKETERTANARKNSYAYKKQSEESEEWIPLEVHGTEGKWSSQTKEALNKIKCKDTGNELKLSNDVDGDEGYVKSLNYLDAYSGEAFVEDLSDWKPSNNASAEADGMEMEADGTASSDVASATEQATAELAAKLAILLQTGNGTMIPYRVIRSRFNVKNVSNELLTMALSSCAILVRGNFALKSTLAKFIDTAAEGGGEKRKKLIRELRDLILLLLNVHGLIQRERLVKVYAVKSETTEGYDLIDGDMITFILKTVARKDIDCWVAKVDDDEEFGSNFPEVAACHALYWMKKKELLNELVELYENVE